MTPAAVRRFLAVDDLGAELGLNMRGVLTKPVRLETFKRTLEEMAAPGPHPDDRRAARGD
jgi:hypothetical protein